MPSRLQLSNRLVHFLVGVQRRLEEVDVELDAERLQVRVLLPAQLLHGKPLDGVEVGSIRIVRVGSDVALGDVPDVLAVIAALRKHCRAAAQFLDPRLYAAREAQDLAAPVVVVELARHAPTGPLEQRRDCVAQGRLTAVADVQRTGRVGRDELDVHGPTLPHIASPVALASREHRLEDAGELRCSEKKIDEPGAGDFDLADQTLRELQGRDQPLGDRPGLLLERLGEGEREVGGDVAVRGVARPLELDRGGGQGHLQPRCGIRQRRADHLVRLHLSPEFFFFLARSAGFVSATDFDSGLGLDSAAGFASSFCSGLSPARL